MRRFQGHMSKFIAVLILVLLSGILAVCVAQQESLSPELKAAALKDADCKTAADTQNADAKRIDGQNVDTKNSEPTVEALPIRTGGRDVGTIIEVQGVCHCQ